MGAKKDSPRVHSKDIYKYIAQHSSLNQSQVKECLDLYGQLIKEIALCKFTPTDITIPFPHLGVFYFGKVKGMKKGKYKTPRIHNGEMIYEEFEITEDMPSSYNLQFRLNIHLAKDVKDMHRGKTR